MDDQILQKERMDLALDEEHLRQQKVSFRSAHYQDICRIAMLAGQIMADNGAEAYRVEDTAVRLLKTTGFEYAEAHFSVTGLILTLDDPSIQQPLTLVRRISRHSSNLGLISRTNDISRRFVEGKLTIQEAEQELKRLRSPHRYNPLILFMANAVIPPFFTFMFNGNVRDALCAFLIGLVLASSVLLFDLADKNETIPLFFRNFLSAFCIGVGFYLFYDILPIGQNAGPIISGSIMPLVPGMLLTVAIRDLLNGDYISGMSRLLESSIIALSIAAGVSISIRLFEHIRGSYQMTVPDSYLLTHQTSVLLFALFQALCSFISSIGFVVLFQAEPRHLIPCGAVGASAWFVYELVFAAGLSGALAIFLAALTASILSFMASRHLKTPVTVFFTGGIFCLVPGAGIFQAMYYYISGSLHEGSLQLLSTLETAGLIAIALAVQNAVFRLAGGLKKRPQGQ